MKDRNKLPTKLLWIDLEMTGLHPEKDRIIEVGVIITDFELNEIDSYEAIIKQDINYDELDQWIKDNMSDLIRESQAKGEPEHEVQAKLVEIIDKHFDGPVILAGNSIHQDRRFIRQWWHDFESRLHYRMLDVSSFKVWVMGRQGRIFHKPEQHRALEDIRGSIEELKGYTKDLDLT